MRDAPDRPTTPPTQCMAFLATLLITADDSGALVVWQMRARDQPLAAIAWARLLDDDGEAVAVTRLLGDAPAGTCWVGDYRGWVSSVSISDLVDVVGARDWSPTWTRPPASVRRRFPVDVLVDVQRDRARALLEVVRFQADPSRSVRCLYRIERPASLAVACQHRTDVRIYSLDGARLGVLGDPEQAPFNPDSRASPRAAQRRRARVRSKGAAMTPWGFQPDIDALADDVEATVQSVMGDDDDVSVAHGDNKKRSQVFLTELHEGTGASRLARTTTPAGQVPCREPGLVPGPRSWQRARKRATTRLPAVPSRSVSRLLDYERADADMRVRPGAGRTTPLTPLREHDGLTRAAQRLTSAIQTSIARSQSVTALRSDAGGARPRHPLLLPIK